MDHTISPLSTEPSFDAHVRARGAGALVRGAVTTLQVNAGKLCNMACHHCHVDAGPKRTESMPARVVERIIELLDANPAVRTLDITGGAPELNPHFRTLVAAAAQRGRRVLDRCNLTVFFEPGMEDVPEFLAEHGVHVIASLPCYQADNVEKQRGRGAFSKSIEALRRLNALGYGGEASALALSLVYNPVDDSLPPPQQALERKYKDELARSFGISFHDLLTITNMPIKRFADMLAREGRLQAYLGILVNHFNPATVPSLMCRSLVSVGWDGKLYDCDFNQMLELPLGAGRRDIWSIDTLDALEGAPVTTASHCFGCTAGAGSSCSGAIA